MGKLVLISSGYNGILKGDQSWIRTGQGFFASREVLFHRLTAAEVEKWRSAHASHFFSKIHLQSSGAQPISCAHPNGKARMAELVDALD